jgi:hypothetical protein
MPLSSLREYLDKNNIEYVVVSNSVAYTAQGIAALTHIPAATLTEGRRNASSIHRKP